MTTWIQLFFIITITVLFCTVQSTKVRQCQSFPGKLAHDSVNISNCEEAPCRLRRKTEVVVNVKFVPENDIEKLVTRVHMTLAGIPFPFIGVDGTNACDKIFQKDGKTKASCPLKKGEEYVYQSSFKVLEIYPTVRGVVHWALNDSKNKKDIHCFEILAKIM